MRIENLVINCTARYPRTCRRTPFEVVVYELNYSSEDKDLMDLLRTKAEELTDRKSTRLNSSHTQKSRMPSSA